MKFFALATLASLTSATKVAVSSMPSTELDSEVMRVKMDIKALTDEQRESLFDAISGEGEWLSEQPTMDSGAGWSYGGHYKKYYKPYYKSYYKPYYSYY